MLQDDYSKGYRRVYKMRTAGEDGLSIVVALPKIVVQRAARERGLSLSEFLDKYRAVAVYNGFEGIHYTFEPAGDGNRE